MNPDARVCRKCRRTLPLTEFHRDKYYKSGSKNVCRTCTQEAAKPRHYDPDRKKDEHLRSLYGITLEEYNEKLASQNGVCAICKRPPSVRKLHVDHDHITGQVRGLLCHTCNFLLGNCNDDIALLQSAMEYLWRYVES